MSPRRPPRIRSPHRLVTASLISGVLLSGCGDDHAPDRSSFTSFEPGSPTEITPAEVADFQVPSDGVLTESQITGYLRTSLLQFDLVREGSGRLARGMETMQQRESWGRALAQLQNRITATQTPLETAELVGDSFVRSARTLGYNPVEMEWVREQMAEISATLMMSSLQDGAARAASELREQVRSIQDQQPGGPPPDGTAEYLRQLLATADEIEAASHQGGGPSPARDVQALRRARPAVTDEMWVAIGFAGGASGLMALTGWSDPGNTEIQAHLDEWRRLFADALENRASPALIAR
jgi:hypothetical protein